MNITERTSFIEDSESKKNELENKTEDAENEAAAQKAIFRSIDLPDDCVEIKNAVENDLDNSIENYTANEISKPAQELESKISDIKKEAIQDASKLEKGEQAIENMISQSKNFELNIGGTKNEISNKHEFVDEQTKLLTRIDQELTASMIRADRIKNLK